MHNLPIIKRRNHIKGRSLFAEINSDKRCVTSDELINVILDMINVVKSIPAGSLDSQEILKHGKSKREQLGKRYGTEK